MKRRFEGTFLRSAVGRRVFFLFMLSAFAPAALLAVVSYSNVYNLVNDYAEHDLIQTSHVQGRALYNRLLGAHFLLNAKAAQNRIKSDREAHEQFAWDHVFQRTRLMVDGAAVMRFLSADGNSSIPLPNKTAAHLVQGEVALLLPQSGSASHNPWLAVAVDVANPARGILMAEFQPAYLWGDPEDLSYQTNVCVFAKNVRLSCSSNEVEASAAKLAEHAVEGATEIQDGWLGASSGLFLNAKFSAPDWTIVALRPNASAATSLATVTSLLLGITVLTLLLVALLSLVQIRRTLVPLEGLIEGTRRIAREQFDQPVRAERDDEFGQLALSLNDMAQRLSNQIGAIRALSAIDQEILSHLDVAQIILRVHARILEILPQAGVNIMVSDTSTGDVGTIYIRRTAEVQISQIQLPWEARDLAVLMHCRDGVWFDANTADVPSQAARAGLGAMDCYVLPIFWRDQIDAVIVVGVDPSKRLNDNWTGQVRDLGNRVGVALAARAREAQLVFLAHHDDLTGLPNRALLRDRLQQQIAQQHHVRNQFALLFLDLDRFKNINDSMGHENGDRLLRVVGERLRACAREGDTLARLGGDEFVILLIDIRNPRHAAEVATKVLDSLAQPFHIDGKDCFVGVSIGIAIFPDDGNTAEELLKRADIAMYLAKTTRSGSFLFFEESMNVEQRERAFMEQELHLAIARDQFFIHYQPRLALVDGRFLGAEALLRWNHPELGMVSPAIFIPLAEEIGFIDILGPWVMQHVCEQIAAWRAAGYDSGTVAVNVSGREFKSHDLFAQVRQVLDKYALPASCLELEITEGVLIEDVESVIGVLDQLTQLGVSIALDDFGTGFSSMAYLRRLPVHVLKIDQSFVRDLIHDESARSIVQAIIALAHALHKVALAEGVETREQAELLYTLGCEEAQGYYFSRPVSAVALEERMRQNALSAVKISTELPI
ncbi:MAG: EAL domain-containing protein [Herbaspirillum sp.]